MGQSFFPDNIPDLAIATTTTITMGTTHQGRPTRITIGGQQYRYSSAITINFATTGINALDAGTVAANTLYYIYAVVSGTTPGLVASTSSSGPSGYTRYKEIGRCRTLGSAATLAAVANRDDGKARKTVELIESTNSFTITAVTTPPTPGSGSTYFRETTRRLDVAFIRFEFRQTVAGSAGSGDYFFPLPANTTVDYQRAGKLSAASSQGSVGAGILEVNAAYFELNAFVANSGAYINKIYFGMTSETSPVGTFWGANGSLANTSVILSCTVEVPIVEWKDLYT